MEKRGQSETTWVVIGLVFAAAIILLSVYIIFAFSGAFAAPSAEKQTAINNFKALTNEVQKKLSTSAKLNTSTLDYQIPKGFILVGFDKDWHGVFVSNACNGEGIIKPPQCQDKACLCLYEDTIGDDFEGDSDPDKLVVPCETFDGDITISGPADNFYNFYQCEGKEISFQEDDYDNDCSNDGAKKIPDLTYGYGITKYEFLIIYGKCVDTWGIKKLYIEKYVEGDKIYLFISAKTPRVEELREKQMKSRYS